MTAAFAGFQAAVILNFQRQVDVMMKYLAMICAASALWATAAYQGYMLVAWLL